jgi:hypothetical protein
MMFYLCELGNKAGLQKLHENSQNKLLEKKQYFFFY